MRTQTGTGRVIRPELKRWDCGDYDPVESWVPDDDEVVYWLTLAIGLPDSEAADNFDVCVATPAGLKSATYRAANRPLAARPTAIVVQSYSWAGVMSAVQARLDECGGRDWLEILEKLRERFLWEYEGMR